MCEAVMCCGRYDVLSRLPTSLSELTAESAGLSHLMSGIKQLHVSAHLTSTDTRRLAADLLQFVFQVPWLPVCDYFLIVFEDIHFMYMKLLVKRNSL